MKLYLVRHGESSSIGSDDERPLSDQGKQDIQNLSNFLSGLNLQVSKVLQSKKYRAKQTAQILLTNINVTKEVETRDELDPLHSVLPIVNEIEDLNEDLILVGHMPFMGKLTDKLITDHEDKDIVVFKAGSMLCLEKIENKQWVIRWMLNPELFKKGLNL